MVFKTILLMVGTGIVATIVGDLVSKCVFTKSHWNLVGRWVAGIPQGKFINAEISSNPSVPFEAILGWGVHYLTGIIYGVMYIGICVLIETLPNFFNALTFGVLTVVAPFFILMPGMGMGVLARKTPTPLKNCLSSLFVHAIFGTGLWLGSQLLTMLL